MTDTNFLFFAPHLPQPAADEMRISTRSAFSAISDVAPKFHPVAIGVWRSALPCWVVMTAVRGAEPSVERSAADRRAAA